MENYFDVYLRTPGIRREDMARALLARGNARKRGGEKLLSKAQEGANSRSTSLRTVSHDPLKISKLL